MAPARSGVRGGNPVRRETERTDAFPVRPASVHMKTKSKLFRILSLGLAVGVFNATAKSPFEIIATPVNQPAITASGSNLTDFLGALFNAQDQFQQLNNRAYFASLTFLGVPNAITFQTNAPGTAVTMTLRPIGINETFTGGSRQEVDDQIEDYFKKRGVSAISDFLAAIAKESTVAVTDGNPNAATSVAASSTFMAQGFTPVDEIGVGVGQDAAPDGTPAKPRFGSFGLGFNAGRFEAAGLEGETIDFSLSGLSIGFGERVRLLTPVYLNYMKVEGAQVAGLGANLALPIRFKVMGKDNAWNWRVTPMAGINARASVDLAGGALLWQGGLINSVDYRVSPKLVVCFVNQLTVHKSIKLEYDDFSFDPKVNQQILKNGLRVVSPLTRRIIGDFFAVDTRFLKDAAVDQFWSFGGSIGFRVSQRFNLTLGANYDTGDNFKSYSAGLSSAWKW